MSPRARLPEEGRARRALCGLVELSGVPRRDIAKRLQECGAGVDLNRLLRESLAQDIKLHHIIALCRILELHPLEFFRMVWREPDARSPCATRIEGLLRPLRQAQPDALTQKEER